MKALLYVAVVSVFAAIGIGTEIVSRGHVNPHGSPHTTKVEIPTSSLLELPSQRDLTLPQPETNPVRLMEAQSDIALHNVERANRH